MTVGLMIIAANGQIKETIIESASSIVFQIGTKGLQITSNLLAISPSSNKKADNFVALLKVSKQWWNASPHDNFLLTLFNVSA